MSRWASHEAFWKMQVEASAGWAAYYAGTLRAQVGAGQLPSKAKTDIEKAIKDLQTILGRYERRYANRGNCKPDIHLVEDAAE